ncbi:MAG: hypothetical protein RBR32_06690 [Bacteroidales bacterium]|nr:hypothetical protein [Bacteroidales bacterium]
MERLQSLTKRLERLKEKEQERIALKKVTQDQLKERYGCSTKKEADKYFLKLKKKREKLNDEKEKRLNNLEKEMKDEGIL